MEVREKILQAAEQVIRAKGLARATTKEIARIAGCSEGSLYNHFTSKEDLFLQVTRELLPNFKKALTLLHQRKGTGTIRDNLEEVANAALEFFEYSMPVLASVFSEPGLLAGHREGFRERNEGPHRPNEAVAAYIHEEQFLGRLSPDLKPRIVADLLLGSCFQHAFHQQFLGREESKTEREVFVKNVVQTLMERS